MIYWDSTVVFSASTFSTNADGTTLSWTGGTAVTTLNTGQFIQITGAGTGLTLGYYRIMSRVAARSVVIDRSAGASKTGGTASLLTSRLTFYNHPIEGRISQVHTIYDTTVNAHSPSTTITTNKKFNLALTDLASDATGMLVSSATGGFTADMVGRYLNVTAGTGFVVGKHTIVTYTDANNIVLATSVGASKTSGTGNVPFTAPPRGILYITAAATGQSEKVAYSSWQNNGGIVEYTVTAPVQTFASGDTVKIWDMLFQIPGSPQNYVNNVQIAVMQKVNDTPATAVASTFTLKDNEHLLMLTDLSIFISEISTVNTVIYAAFTVGEIDDSGPDPISNSFNSVTFTPTADCSCGVINTATNSQNQANFYYYNCAVKSYNDFQWYVASAYGTNCVGKYSTLMGHAYMTGGNWNWKRINALKHSGLLKPTTWSGSAVMSDVKFGALAGNMGDGGYGTSNPVFYINNANIPFLNEQPDYRIYMSNMSTGDGLKFIFTDCETHVLASEIEAYGSANKNIFGLNCFTKYVFVVDYLGNPISGATGRLVSNDGSIFNQTFTTDANGYANSGNPLLQSWTFGSNGAVYFGPPQDRIQLVLGAGIDGEPSRETINCSPYTITVQKPGYETISQPVIVTLATKLQQQIVVRLRQSSGVGRDAMGSEFR